MAVSIGVAVGHRICRKDDVIAEVVSIARSRFHAGAGGNASQDDLGHIALAELVVQRCAKERANALFGNEVVAGMLLQFGNEFGPIRREGIVGTNGFGATWRHADHIDENNGEATFARASCAARAMTSPAG